MDLFCFCHLRWDFVYQRPQHVMTRFGTRGRVFFWEEPCFVEADTPRLARAKKTAGVTVLTPCLPHGLSEAEALRAEQTLLDQYLAEQQVSEFIAWYLTPMALRFSGHLQPALVIYDCMDELSAFQGAPPTLIDLEKQLFAKADIVFTGGASLYASKRKQHPNVYCFPSSIDRAHFAQASQGLPDPADQAEIPHPRIGFYGVLDERLDRDLLRELAAMQPDWHFVLIGPVVKIREDELPRAANLHYLGKKEYAELPHYLAGWDVAMLPFARNASTRFISPTKTPEYLAGGKRVVSTPIQDVVNPYGEKGLVEIAENAEAFARAIRQSLEPASARWSQEVNEFLRRNSWDQTFEGMGKAIDASLQVRAALRVAAAHKPSARHADALQAVARSAVVANLREMERVSASPQENSAAA